MIAEASILGTLACPVTDLRSFAAIRRDYARWLQECDSTALTLLARRHKLGPLLAWRERFELPGCLPRKAKAELLGDLLVNSQRNQRLLSEGMRVRYGFRAFGVRALPRKGQILATTHWPAQGTRMLGDLDFLIGREDSEMAIRVAQDLGYAAGRFDETASQVVDSPRKKNLFWKYYMNSAPLMFRPSDDPFIGQYALDLRYELLERHHPGDLSCQRVFEGGSTDDGRGMARWRLEFLLMDICVHARREADAVDSVAESKALMLFRLVDALHLLGDSEMDQGALVALASEVGCSDDVAWVFRHCDVLMPGSVHSSFLNSLLPWQEAWDYFGVYEAREARWSSGVVDRWFEDGDADRLVAKRLSKEGSLNM